MQEITKEVFKGKQAIVQKVELFEDMISITTEEMSEEELNEKKTELINKLNEKYEDPGATASDNKDGNITDKIKMSGKVDTSKPGTYTITYTVEDLSGNKTTVTRTVIVKGKDSTGGNTTEGNTTGGENNNTVENKVNNE